MNRQVPIDRNESNPMLLGYMELVKEENQNLQKKQQELSKAVSTNSEMAGVIEQHKKATAELQIHHQKKLSEMMKDNPAIIELMEKHKKEVAEMQMRQRQEMDALMKEDEDIAETMKQQEKEARSLTMMQQQMLNQKILENKDLIEYVNDIKATQATLQENQQMFEQELFKAVYMTPVKIIPEPTKDEEGNVKLAEGSKLALQVVSLPNKQNVMMAFTDNKEYQKWEQAKDTHTLSMTMKEFIGAVLKDPSLAGININPYSANLIIPRAKLESMAKNIMNAAQGRQNKNIEVVEADV